MTPPRSRRPGSARRRTPARRRGRPRRTRRSGGSSRGPLLIAAGVAGLLAFNWLAERPALATTLAVGLILAGCGAAAIALAWRRARRRRRRTLTRSVEVADRLTGPEFEQWVADLLARTGFGQVKVSGGAGDLGADVTARAPDGRLVVLQCKRYAIERRVGSPDVQRFAGTARQLHGADIAAIVTTSTFTAPAAAAAGSLGIRLVDRETLARWAADGLPPLALAHHATPEPADSPRWPVT